MKTLRAFVPLVLLAACAAPPADPIGRYRLDTADKTLVLDVRASGDYVLQIDGPDSMTDEIRGRWTDEKGTSKDAGFQGIVWHGSAPEGGKGWWLVSFESDGGICLDGEGLVCFVKDGTT
ncbi:hypothetical protein [Massilia sp. Leaf139]|uniref:hypothetical protein n=1 Tax=Massilia sp. Leaf139 TaxID=1736272 RepID=UPI0012E7E496|nr:hypothetical protein [Massilia sp. Leaf139]